MISVEAAGPSVTCLFPAGASQGTTTEVEAGGSFSQWPANAWVNTSKIQVKAAKAKGKFQVIVNDDADCGVAWMRFFDGAGASSLRPFLIGSLAETREQEPNNDAAKTELTKLPTVVNGRLQKSGDVDSFRVSLKAAETLVAALEANRRLAAPMDAVLQIVSPDGFVYEQNHDEWGLDPLLAFTAPEDGEYVVRLFAFPAQPNSTIGFAGGVDYVYRLTLTSGPMLSHTIPLAAAAGKATELQLVGWNIPRELAGAKIEPGAATHVLFSKSGVAGDFRLPVVARNVVVAAEQSPADSHRRIEIGMVISGSIHDSGKPDRFRFSAKKGEQRRIRIVSDRLGFLLDPVVKITGTDGKNISETDDVAKERDPTVLFKAPAEGEYDLAIFDLYRRGGKRFAYRLDFDQPEPDFRLTIKSDVFAAKPDAAIEIEVAIGRLEGYIEPVTVSAIELPAGWQVEPIISADKTDTAKVVKLKLTAGADAVSGPFQIQGRSGELVRFATFEAAGATHHHAWLHAEPLSP